MCQRTTTGRKECSLDRAAALAVSRLRERGVDAQVVGRPLGRRKVDLIPEAAWADPRNDGLDELLDAVAARLRNGGIASLAEVVAVAADAARTRRACVAVFPSPDAITATERLVVLAETRELAPDGREDLRHQIVSVAADPLGSVRRSGASAPGNGRQHLEARRSAGPPAATSTNRAASVNRPDLPAGSWHTSPGPVVGLPRGDLPSSAPPSATPPAAGCS